MRLLVLMLPLNVFRVYDEEKPPPQLRLATHVNIALKSECRTRMQLQPWQLRVAFLMHPASPAKHLLVAHATGTRKTNLSQLDTSLDIAQRTSEAMDTSLVAARPVRKEQRDRANAMAV